jgi:hypothetical protein
MEAMRRRCRLIVAADLERSQLQLLIGRIGELQLPGQNGWHAAEDVRPAAEPSAR